MQTQAKNCATGTLTAIVCVLMECPDEDGFSNRFILFYVLLLYCSRHIDQFLL